MALVELRVTNKSLEGRLEEERKEKDSLERKSVSERRMLQNRSKTLFEQVWLLPSLVSHIIYAGVFSLDFSLFSVHVLQAVHCVGVSTGSREQ